MWGCVTAILELIVAWNYALADMDCLGFDAEEMFVFLAKFFEVAFHLKCRAC